MKYLCLDFGGTGVKYAIIDENFQLYDVNKENKIFQSHDEMITWVLELDAQLLLTGNYIVGVIILLEQLRFL